MAGTPFISQSKDVRGISVLHGVQPLVASIFSSNQFSGYRTVYVPELSTFILIRNFAVIS